MRIYHKISIFCVLLSLCGLTINAQTKKDGETKHHRSDVYSVKVRKPGELKQRIPEKMISAIRVLTIEGNLSGHDVEFLKYLANRATIKDTLGNKLEPFFDLDLTKATIMNPYGSSNSNLSDIPNDFMKGCKLLRRIALPVNTENIGKSAFLGCSRIEEVKLPMGIKTIGDYSFSGCVGLESVYLPRTLKTIGIRCFEKCRNLKIISLPDGLENIGEGAFENSGLVKVQMAESVKSIGKEALANTKIEYLEIPPSLQVFDTSIINGCDRLENLYVSAENNNYSDLNGILTDKKRTTVIKVPIKRQGKFVLPEGITKIDNFAFKGCEKVDEIVLPKSLIDIGVAAFSGCINLQKINIEGKVESIRDSAFSKCGMTEIDLSRVKYLGKNVLSGCSNLKSVKLPLIEDIPIGMFERSGVESIELPQGVKTIGNSSFKGCQNLHYIEIPQSVTQIKESAFAESGLQKIILSEAISSIDHDAFSGCKYLREVQLPLNMRSLSSQTFRGCWSLDSIKLPDAVQIIEKGAFQDCRSLQNVKLSSSLNKISNSAFKGCTKLRNIDLPITLKEIEAYAFAQCGVTMISLPEGIATINNGTFKECSNLERIVLPSSVLAIGTDAFLSCITLTEVSLPSSLTTLGDNVFQGCASLESFDIPKSVTTIGRKTLYDCKSIVTVICHWLEPLKIKDIIDNNQTSLHVPAGTGNAYKKAKGWKKFKNIVEY